MRNYIVFVSVLLVCSSFTICDKLIEQKDKSWKLYIFPFCGDSTTCIIRDCNIKPGYKERDYTKQGPWKKYLIEYVYTEYLFVSGVEKQKSTFTSRKEGGKLITRYYSQSKFGEQQSAYEEHSRLPESKSYEFNDSVHLTVEYFKTGGIKGYQVENWNTGSTFGVEWDSTYNYKWQGYFKSNSRVDTLQRFDQAGTETLLIIKRSNDKKGGTWTKYDRNGAVLTKKEY
jgi:hypothetical protein